MAHAGMPRAAKKLTPEQVQEIKASPEKGVALAARFGITPAYVSLIRRGQRRQFEDRRPPQDQMP